MSGTPKPAPSTPLANQTGGAGRRDSTTSSLHRAVRFDKSQTPLLSPDRSDRDDGRAHQLRPRRSSMSMRFNSIRHAGGVNSIENFARSWQRAASFFEINPAPSTFVVLDGTDEDPDAPQQLLPDDHRTLLRQALQRERPLHTDDAIEEGEASLYNTPERPNAQRSRFSSVRASAIGYVAPQLSSVLSGSYGTTYSSRAQADPVARRRVSQLFRHRPSIGPVDLGKEAQPLLVKRIKDTDGGTTNVIVGQSTFYQTVFNQVNVLVGVGILAIPMGLQQAGWVVGLTFLLLAFICTAYTAKLLAKCLDVDNSLVTFSDLALVAFGAKARLATSLLFSVELLATCVALVVLFADSLDALIPGWGTVMWKIVCGAILLPLSFVPLRFLSFTSMMGILSCCGIVGLVFLAGLVKTDSPGSLVQPATTHLWPERWALVPGSLGILMSPLGGHSVFPNLYRDMRHPHKYRKAVDVTYGVTASLDTFLGVIGVIMYGSTVRDAITSNIFAMPIEGGYPAWLKVVISICVAVIPITKIPLNSSPIVSTVEQLAGLDQAVTVRAAAGPDIETDALLSGHDAVQRSATMNVQLARYLVRTLITASFVGFAIIVPEFHRIMSLLGAVACFSICIILPIAFHLKIFGPTLSRTERTVNWIVLVISSLLAIVSTAFNFIPTDVLEGAS